MDKIGVVRDHRWLKADEQAALLKSRCRKVVSLGGGKAPHVTREALVMLARPGTVVEMVHAFLLAEPRRKKLSGGMRKDFRDALAALQRRGAMVFDLTSDVGSDKPKAFMATVNADIGRSNRGRSSQANGANSKRGRVPANFTDAQHEKAGDIWGNTKRYPNERDTVAPLAAIISPNGRKYTKHRARAKFGGRT